MLYPKIFGFVIAAAALGTSIAMAVMGGRFQKVEQAAYGGKGKPWWFYLVSAAVIVFYGFTLYGFISSPEKTWAGWVIMVVIPVGWAIKGALITFNRKGQEMVTSISGDEAWRKVALARLPIAIVLAVLALLA